MGTGSPPEVPDPETDPAGRAAWERRAGMIAAYREYRGIPDEQLSLGQSPPAAQALPRVLWQAAMDQLDVDPNAAAWARRDDVELYQAREAWALALYHADEYGPRAVGNDLAATHQLAAEISDDAVLTRAEAATHPYIAPEREELAEKASRYDALAESYRADARVLEDERAARAEWWQRTAALRDADEAAATELERRGLPAWRDLQRPTASRAVQQLTLSSPEPDLTSPPTGSMNSHGEPHVADIRDSTERQATDRNQEAEAIHEIVGEVPIDRERAEIGEASRSSVEGPADAGATDRGDVTRSLQQTDAGLRALREQAHAARLGRARDGINSQRVDPGAIGFEERAERDQMHLEAERRGEAVEQAEPFAGPSSQQGVDEDAVYGDVEYDDWDD